MADDEENATPDGDDINIENGNNNDNGDGDNSPAEKEEVVVEASSSTSPDAPPSTSTTTKRNINSYYGHKIGFLQTLSLTLNAGLMVYAHVGLSAVILSSQDPSITSTTAETIDNGNLEVADNDGKCNNEQDIEAWISNGGENTRPQHSNYCSREYEYNNGVGCLVNKECIQSCFQETYGYSTECSICFAEVPTCSVVSGCTMKCAADSFAPECTECNIPCIDELHVCTGLPEVDINATIPPDQNNATNPLPHNNAVAGNSCNDFDLEAITEWYNVYDLTFVKSIKDAWNGDAKLLAVIIVVFSGIWPYLKNVMLVIIWYLPATVETQTSTLLWLSRLSKYTLVDVFAVIGVLVGVQLQLNVGGTEAVTRAEPRFGIIAFFLATVWEFLQIELIKAMHERKVLGAHRNNTNTSGDGERLKFKSLWIPVIILVGSIGFYIAGAMTEIVYFASTNDGNSGVCKKSYNLVTLGNALINDMSMTDNSAPGQTWVLYLSYVILNLAFPVLTHVLQFCFIVGWSRSKKLKRLIEWTLAIWCFACIEVLLIGIFAVEYKFPNLVMKIAGDTNAGFLDIDSNLGAGFYILIAYSVVAGLMQASLRIRNGEAVEAPGQPQNKSAQATDPEMAEKETSA